MPFHAHNKHPHRQRIERESLPRAVSSPWTLHAAAAHRPLCDGMRRAYTAGPPGSRHSTALADCGSQQEPGRSEASAGESDAAAPARERVRGRLAPRCRPRPPTRCRCAIHRSSQANAGGRFGAGNDEAVAHAGRRRVALGVGCSQTNAFPGMLPDADHRARASSPLPSAPIRATRSILRTTTRPAPSLLA